MGGTSFNNTITGNPYGTFDIGFTVNSGKNVTNNNFFNSGSNQAYGIADGSTAVFTPSLTGNSLALDSLTAASFANTLSDKGGKFFAAFIFGTGGSTTSDKVDGVVVAPVDAPVPSTLFLLGSGLLAVGLRWRFRKK